MAAVSHIRKFAGIEDDEHKHSSNVDSSSNVGAPNHHESSSSTVRNTSNHIEIAPEVSRNEAGNKISVKQYSKIDDNVIGNKRTMLVDLRRKVMQNYLVPISPHRSDFTTNTFLNTQNDLGDGEYFCLSNAGLTILKTYFKN